MDGTVGAYEAKTRLAALLDRVENGETLTITRNGRPVARLVPADPARPMPGAEATARVLGSGVWSHRVLTRGSITA